MTDVTIMQRELTPFEHRVLDLLCQGKSNVAIAHETSHTEKVIENTVSRSARVFGITSDGETNVRVLLALAYRTHFGDAAFDAFGLPCQHLQEGPDGRMICARHIE